MNNVHMYQAHKNEAIRCIRCSHLFIIIIESFLFVHLVQSRVRYYPFILLLLTSSPSSSFSRMNAEYRHHFLNSFPTKETIVYQQERERVSVDDDGSFRHSILVSSVRSLFRWSLCRVKLVSQQIRMNEMTAGKSGRIDQRRWIDEHSTSFSGVTVEIIRPF